MTILTDKDRLAVNEECRAGRLSHIAITAALGGQIFCCNCQHEIGEHQKFKIIDRMRAAHLICDPP